MKPKAKSRLSRLLGRSLYVLASRLPKTEQAPFGALSGALRLAAARLILPACGRRVTVEKGAHFASDVCIGDRSGIGIRAEIGAGTVIGCDVMMGADCLILTRNHLFSRTDLPMREQGMVEKPVRIGNDVWIGARVTILPGAVIGDGAVIGAGSVVRGTVAPFSVVRGNPARVLYQRGEMHDDKT